MEYNPRVTTVEDKMKLLNREHIEKILHILIVILVVIQPLIDMDYLFYDFLNSYGLPRPSTIIRFLIIPALVICSFFLREKKKKRILTIGIIYGVLLAGYFILHCRQDTALYSRLDLTENFRFDTWQELTYVLTLVIPFGVSYFCYHEHFKSSEIRSICMILSGMISIPILIGDLFVFAKSTYYGNTVANLFAWFSGVYKWYHPRTLASKFFFNEGNTIGILLFMLLPLMYYYFAKSEEKKQRRRIGTLILIQSLSMQILATRVATYGAVLIPLAFLLLYIIDAKFFTKTKPLKTVLIFCLCLAALTGSLFEYTPAVQNQKVDAKNDTALLHNGMAALGEAELANGEDLIPGTKEYINFYVYMFETYGIKARYIQSVPSMYYTDYYSYDHDPKFWVDVTFMPVFDRVSGRQVETIFFNYKYQKLTSKEKILGMGYSTFMNGSIVLEQDFKQQVYTLGYAGELLCIMPWIGVCLYGVFMFLKHWKQMISLENICLVMSLGAGLGSAWLSGHMLDQFVTTVFAALIVAVLLNRVHDAKEVQK